MPFSEEIVEGRHLPSTVVPINNCVEYTYGDGVWRDLLTGYGDKTITYDSQGNPVNYLDHTLTWEKGRQLKSFDNVTYTYNANGIRTSKTVNGVKHTYTLDGTKILREVWGDNTLVPLYDNEESVCGILYNDVPYYFLKNLQGDVIAITEPPFTSCYDKIQKKTLQDFSCKVNFIIKFALIFIIRFAPNYRINLVCKLYYIFIVMSRTFIHV